MKRWPYWVKGGVVFGVIGATVVFAFNLLGSYYCHVIVNPGPPSPASFGYHPPSPVHLKLDNCSQVFLFVFNILSFPLYVSGINYYSLQYLPTYLGLFLMVCSYAIVGAFLGWLYGKIRNRS